MCVVLCSMYVFDRCIFFKHFFFFFIRVTLIKIFVKNKYSKNMCSSQVYGKGFHL